MSAVDYAFLAKLLVSALMLGLLVVGMFCLPTPSAWRVPASRLQPRRALPVREFDSARPLDPALVAAIPFEETDRDTFVDAVPTPEPVCDDDTVWLIAECFSCQYTRAYRSTKYEPRCSLCGHRWTCVSRDDGRKVEG